MYLLVLLEPNKTYVFVLQQTVRYIRACAFKENPDDTVTFYIIVGYRNSVGMERKVRNNYVEKRINWSTIQFFGCKYILDNKHTTHSLR